MPRHVLILSSQNTGSTNRLDLGLCNPGEEFCLDDDRLLRENTFAQHLVVTLLK